MTYKSVSQRGKEYATAAFNGTEDVPKNVAIACGRYLEMFENPDIIHNPEMTDTTGKQIEMMKLPEGTGRITLIDWECMLLDLIWSFFWKKDGTRVKNEVLIVIPRKAGKSSICGIIALFEICKPVGGITKPDVMIYGPNENTCLITMKKIQSVLSSDKAEGGPFTRHFGLKKRNTAVESTATFGSIGMISLDSKNLEGQTLQCAIVDELSSCTNRDGLTAVKTSFAASPNGLLLMTTTSGTEPFSLYNVARNDAIDWINNKGVKERHGYFALLYEAEKDDDIYDPVVWRRVHPSLGITVQESFYEDYAIRASSSDYDRQEFAARMLCVPNEGGYGGWISTEDLEASLEPPVATMDQMVGKYKKCWMGLDLSDMHDMTGIAMLFEMHDGTLCTFWEAFYPRGRLAPDGAQERPGLKDIRSWANDGFVTLCPGKTIDHELVASRIAELHSLLKPVAIMTDTYHAIYEVQDRLINYGINRSSFVEVKKNARNYSTPISTVFRLVKSKRMALQRNPAAWAHLKNCVIRQSWDGGQVIEKANKDSDYKIDMADALIICIVAFLRQKDDKWTGTSSSPLPSEEWTDEQVDQMIW